MSYVALARKWRPRTFTQLVGQPFVNQALINSLNQKRLHHAYLFTGTRGVGKTSIARLFAKALNCEAGISAEPCLQCDTCQSIEQNRFIDLIEIDGASRTRVEDTRDLLDNVPYAPTNARYKIYLIDEVHMLSQHSFNALLKTLEEPPEHVKFLLATTDPQKIPVTVLSRCLQFHLRPIDQENIARHMTTILDAEHISYEPDAVLAITKAANGSMRDALSLLDQAIAVCGQHIETTAVKSLLGYTQQDYARQLLEALAQREIDTLITLSRQIATEGGNFEYALQELVSYLHQISLQQLTTDKLIYHKDTRLSALAQTLTAEDVQLFYQIGIKGQQDILLAPTPLVGFEMTLLRMAAFMPVQFKELPVLTHQNSHPPIAQPIIDPNKEPVSQAPSLPPVANAPSTPIIPVKVKNNVNMPDICWHELIPQLQLTGLTLTAAENSEWVGKNGTLITLRISKHHASMMTTSVMKRLEQALSQWFGETIKLTVTQDAQVTTSPALHKQAKQQEQQQSAAESLKQDPFFQQLKTEFSAELIKDSIATLKDDL